MDKSVRYLPLWSQLLPASCTSKPSLVYVGFPPPTFLTNLFQHQYPFRYNVVLYRRDIGSKRFSMSRIHCFLWTCFQADQSGGGAGSRTSTFGTKVLSCEPPALIEGSELFKGDHSLPAWTFWFLRCRHGSQRKNQVFIGLYHEPTFRFLNAQNCGVFKIRRGKLAPSLFSVGLHAPWVVMLWGGSVVNSFPTPPGGCRMLWIPNILPHPPQWQRCHYSLYKVPFGPPVGLSPCMGEA